MTYCSSELLLDRFLKPSVNLCLLIGDFNPFTLEDVTNKEELTSTILLFVFPMSYHFVPQVL